MAVLPIQWMMYLNNTPKNRPFFDFPAWKDLDTVFGTKYNLKLQLKNGRKKNSQDFSHQVICVQIERFLDLSPSNVHGSISIYDIAYKRYALKAFQHSFTDGEKVFSFDMTFRPPNDLRSFYGHLNVGGQISIDLSKDTDSTADPCIASCPAPEIHASLSHLSSDFGYMLENDAFSDVILKCGDATLFVHKAVLSSRSPVFKAMFLNDMKEAHSKEIVIPDVTPTALKATLNYIYCASTDDFDEKSACELLYAADKYELLELKESCVSYLKGIICNENVFRILDVAILHDESFKKCVYDYIGENFTAIEKSKGWISLKKNNPNLVMDILSDIVKFGK